MLSLSLFCSGLAAAQTTSAPDADQKTCDDLVKYTMDPRQTQRQPRGVYIP